MHKWTNDERMMIACCNDGTRPVIFKIERIDIPETPEEKNGSNSRISPIMQMMPIPDKSDKMPILSLPLGTGDAAAGTMKIAG